MLSSLTTLIQYRYKTLAGAIRQAKEIMIADEECKLSLLVNDMIYFIEDSQNSPKDCYI